MRKVYIVAAKRTPIGAFMGAFKDTSSVQLAQLAVTAALNQAGLQPEHVDELICGTVLPVGQGMGPARQVAMASDIPQEKTAYAINMICGSGMKSITEGAIHIQAGYADIVVATGMENMSQVPHALCNTNRSGRKFGSSTLDDLILRDGLTDAFHHIPMGETAERLADHYQISRSEQDEYALLSQQKASLAQKNGLFAEEIVAVDVGRGRTVADDEFIRHDTTIESLSSLKPAFRKEGTVTAGNASGLNDGASTLILASEEAVAKFNLQPLCEIVSFSEAGLAPELMGLGPVPAIEKALRIADMKMTDIDLLEINEAFAAQALAVTKQLGTDHKVSPLFFDEKLNINGGGIALGHPLGASGNRVMVTLIHSLKRLKKDYGLASLCIGGGMGISMIVKNLSK